MKGFFRSFFRYVIILLIVLDLGLFLAGVEIIAVPGIAPLEGWGKFLPLVFLLVLIGLGVLVEMAYIAPGKEIRREIARFIAGGKDLSPIGPFPLNPDLTFAGDFFVRSLQILKNFKDEFHSGRVLRSEVELAADIQKHVLKKTYPRIPSLDIVADTKSATEVGGDSYDVIAQGDNYYIYLGDVTGHGVASGFVMMVVNALISGFSKMLTNSAEILARTNEILKPRVKSNMLMSLLMVRWDEKDKRLFMTGAGHEYLLVYKKSKNAVFKIKSGGVALGMTRDISKILKEVQVSFEPGDCLVMYTDGITEARNGPKESNLMFGIDRLMEVIQNTGEKTARTIFQNITIELSKFMGYGHRQFDDITLIVVHYRQEESPLVTGEITTSPDQIHIPNEFITEWNWH